MSAVAISDNLVITDSMRAVRRIKAGILNQTAPQRVKQQHSLKGLAIHSKTALIRRGFGCSALGRLPGTISGSGMIPLQAGMIFLSTES